MFTNCRRTRSTYNHIKKKLKKKKNLRTSCNTNTSMEIKKLKCLYTTNYEKFKKPRNKNKPQMSKKSPGH